MEKGILGIIISMGIAVSIVLLQIAYSNPEYSNVVSALPKELRESVPKDIQLLTDASDYNLSVKVYHAINADKAHIFLLVLQNRVSEPLTVSLARLELIKIPQEETYEVSDYPTIGNGSPLTRVMTPYYGETYEIKSNGRLAAVLTDSWITDGVAAGAIYCISKNDLLEDAYCDDSQKKEFQFVSYAITTPLYDAHTGSTKVVYGEWGYPNLSIASDSPRLPADYAYMYAYESSSSNNLVIDKLREKISSLVKEWKNDVIIYHATASRNAIIQASFNHFPVFHLLKNLPDTPKTSYIFVILKYKPDGKMLVEIQKLMEADNYSLRGSGEGMNVRID